ncbi:hypothetical protein DFJ73DRAFT_577066 [Zopfochytrium polystomum]|nr:hypothetical protein DFJ73DRAFT_577066 [Zopfochytrium polystomum]
MSCRFVSFPVQSVCTHFKPPSKALVYLHREFHPTCPAALAEREAVLTSFLVKARSPRRRNLLANFLKPRHRRKTSVSTIATVRSFDAERLRWAQNEELEGRTSVEAAQANAQIRREAAPVDAKGKPPIGNGNRLKGGLRPWFSFGKNSKTKLMEQIEMVEGSGQVPYQSSNSSGNKPNFARKQPSPSDEKVLSYVKKLRSLILPSNVASTICKALYHSPTNLKISLGNLTVNSEEINPMTLHNALKDQNLLEPSDSLFNILVRHLEKLIVYVMRTNLTAVLHRMSNMELRRDEWSNIVSAFATALFEAASEKAVAAIETLARHAQAVQTGHFERLGGRDASVSSLATENFSLYQTPNSASDENIDQPQRHQRSYRNRSDSADGDGNLIGAVCQALAPSESILPPDELKRVADDDTKVFRVNDRLESATTVYDSNEVE